MKDVISYIRSQHDRYLEELKDYLSIPSISSDPEHKADMAKCARRTADLLRGAGIEEVTVHQTDGHPVVTGNLSGAPGKPTVLIYGHYDVQPVDPVELWERDPFEAHIKDDRIIARGASDDKGQVFMHFKAVEAFNRVRGRLPVNVKFIVEGEEEVASVNLPAFLRDHRTLLAADFVLVSDTSMLGPDMPAITYGLRGLTYMEIHLTGPNRDLHSGEYGGAVANPAEILARLIAEVKDPSGRIRIPGFYDRVRELSEQERRLIAQAPFDQDAYMKDLGVDELWGEEPYTTVERTWICLLYTSPSPRDLSTSRMPSSA